MEKIPRAIYTKEFREEAVKLVTEGGMKVPEVGRRLSIEKSCGVLCQGVAARYAIVKEMQFCYGARRMCRSILGR
jgi:hypothetical protein